MKQAWTCTVGWATIRIQLKHNTADSCRLMKRHFQFHNIPEPLKFLLEKNPKSWKNRFKPHIDEFSKKNKLLLILQTLNHVIQKYLTVANPQEIRYLNYCNLQEIHCKSPRIPRFPWLLQIFKKSPGNRQMIITIQNLNWKNKNKNTKRNNYKEEETPMKDFSCPTSEYGNWNNNSQSEASSMSINIRNIRNHFHDDCTPKALLK